MRILGRSDVAIITLYCDTWSQYVAARKTLISLGPGGVLLKGEKGGYYLNPLCNHESALDKRLRGCIAELGLSPSSRTRLHVAAPKEAPQGKSRFFKVVG